MGFPTYDRYTNEELIRAYAAGPARLMDVVQGIDEVGLRMRPRGPASWSIQEIVMHLTDSEIQGAFRVRKAWAEPGAPWPVYDQDVWTPALDHQRAGPEARAVSVALFAALRRATLPFFQRAEPADWRRANGAHPVFGRVTLRDLLAMYADHSERHIGHILTIRTLLGIPLEYALLLPDRLF
jgi:hypothetical protein